MAKKKVSNEDILRKLEALEKLLKEQGPKPDPLEAVRKLAEELSKNRPREIYVPQPYPVYPQYPYPYYPIWYGDSPYTTGGNVSVGPTTQWTYTTSGGLNG